MLETQNNITAIKPKDPDLPEYLDFELLRKEGLEHIGNLSGKIWTDHNIHDPGITILEVLIYALMDLGYRTNIPFKDIIASQNNTTNNFLTPLDILTVNPVTITDYRKLLMEEVGVKNAWLELTHQEQPLYASYNELSCQPLGIKKATQQSRREYNFGNEIKLNGLYHIYIEKDPSVFISDTDLIKNVKASFSKYRNLCEDIVAVDILTPEPFGVCVKVELHSDNLDNNKLNNIYTKILAQIKSFIQPQLNYYSLQQLLDKGKTIDEVFEGRPYKNESFGFLDTEEVENFVRPTEFHLSDLYHVILSIDEVRKIKDLSINQYYYKNKNWVIPIRKNAVPVFSLNNTCVDIYNTQGIININKALLNATFTTPQPFKMPLTSLNTQVPIGELKENLDTHYSIQNDFPTVYGIGEDGLPNRASLKRKTQALQLKGYLMFFDQILANYSCQLANIGNLFSLKPESEKSAEEKRSSFSKVPDSIPGLENLVKFYSNETTISTTIGIPIALNEQWKKVLHNLENNANTELTISTYCNNNDALLKIFNVTSVSLRSIYINQLIDSLSNEAYTITTILDKFGYFYVIQPALPSDIIIISPKSYKTRIKAIEEAKKTAFLATMRQNYTLSTHSDDSVPKKYYFDITYNPVSYLELIQGITENEEEYHTKRKKLLDHLLARFGEEFTDYTLLQYKNNNTLLSEIDCQSTYLNQFGETSRNRGKAYNYLQPSWNTSNISGFEKRVSLISGIKNYNRRNLCNFEVTKSFRIQLKDWNDNLFFRSNKGFETPEELHTVANNILKQLTQPNSYKYLEKNLNDFNALQMHRLFSVVPAEENIIIHKYTYHQELTNSSGKTVVLSKSQKMKSENEADSKKEAFISNINKQDVLDKDNELRLLPVDHENCYLDANALDCSVKTLITWKWHINNNITKEDSSSNSAYDNEEAAWDNLVSSNDLSNYITTHDIATRWYIRINEHLTLVSINKYPDAYKTVAAWRQAKVLGSDKKNYTVSYYDVEDERKVIIRLFNTKGSLIAISMYINACDVNEATLDEFITFFSNPKTDPIYEKVKNKFGFNILGKDNTPLLISYSLYNSKKEALKQLEHVFKLGSDKKNYLLSGDQGNPEYNFILQDKKDNFLALPPEHFQTATDRTKALNAAINYFKKNTVPVFIKEEPRRYVWALHNEDEKVLESESEFSSKARAMANFDKVVINEARKTNNELYKNSFYNFNIVAVPVLYKYLYGVSNAQGNFEPLFVSTGEYSKYDEAEANYTQFVKKLPVLKFAVIDEKKNTSGLYETDSKKLIVNTIPEATTKKAQTVVNYIQSIYGKNLSPKKAFISNKMIENPDGQYEWRLYKKNNPSALNPRQFNSKQEATNYKSEVCNIIPPINLKQCPKKSNIVCPKSNPNYYHYKVSFTDNANNIFELISFKGYTSEKLAEDAWQKEWLTVIEIAKNRDAYSKSGKININEVYANPDSKTCESETFIAVIPKEIKDTIEAKGDNIVTYYTCQSNLYPIYKISNDNEEPLYKFKVSTPLLLIGEDEGRVSSLETLKEDIWVSTNVYDNINDTISAYNYFYNLVGTSNNCMVFCETGKFQLSISEVLAESTQKINTEKEAWGDIDKGNYYYNYCVPSGVREFAYAAENEQNYIPVCDENYWKFKVVGSNYTVFKHTCNYSSETERDKQAIYLTNQLKEIDLYDYIIGKKPTSFHEPPVFSCRSISCLKQYLNILKDIVNESLENKISIVEAFAKKHSLNDGCFYILEYYSYEYKAIKKVIDKFPIHKTDKGYCIKLYIPSENSTKRETFQSNSKGLQPCGCDESDEPTKGNTCNTLTPFVSTNCYSSCQEAFDAFLHIAENITTLGLEYTSNPEEGTLSFQLIDKSKELAYHPQQYESYQEVLDAITRTKNCATDTGMHLLEHILLRPQKQLSVGVDPEEVLTTPNESSECNNVGYVGKDGIRRLLSCLLPICPEYNCTIEWQDDIDENDPCANQPNYNTINYVPGSDPYSFWATLALPSWSKRFRTQEQRTAFEQFLYKEVPALIGLNILWLSPKDMCEFEDIYRRWLLWKEDENSKACFDNSHISPVCFLANAIRHLQSEPPCSNTQYPTDNTDDCNCQPYSGGGGGRSQLYPVDYANSIFWGNCRQQQSEKETTDTKSGEIVSEEKDTKTAIRNRKATYLSNIETASSDSIKSSKSYDRVVEFLKGTPTLTKYSNLVKYFNRYSLQKDNDIEGFMYLMKNVTWYTFDKLVSSKSTIKDTTLDKLNDTLQSLKDKGLQLNTLDKDWKSDKLTLAKNKIEPIKKLLK